MASTQETKPYEYYYGERAEMMAFYPQSARVVLDVGCAAGNFALALKQKYGAEVWGLEYEAEAARQAAEKLDKVLAGDCALNMPLLPDAYFEVIFFNDVLEHLVDPYSVLQMAKSKLKPGGQIISSIPNVRYFRNLGNLLFKKQWKYEESGILDRTHLRFFTTRSIRDMYQELGYEILQHRGINATSRSWKPFLVNLLTFNAFSDIRYVQFVTVARPRA
ncbi:MAG: class I SAM-dependent methyltransferase [Microscillaceae bacterium]|nr:class I SAM-dependent methyltransferase [Microscillaceae bacterium]